MTIASRAVASDPQIIGPIFGRSLGPITIAPAPSAKINAVPRSVGSVKSESFSTPINKTYSAL